MSILQRRKKRNRTKQCQTRAFEFETLKVCTYRNRLDKSNKIRNFDSFENKEFICFCRLLLVLDCRLYGEWML